jgi:hypothetical protein
VAVFDVMVDGSKDSHFCPQHWPAIFGGIDKHLDGKPRSMEPPARSKKRDSASLLRGSDEAAQTSVNRHGRHRPDLAMPARVSDFLRFSPRSFATS